MYSSERDRILARDFIGGFDETSAAAVFGRWMLGADGDHLLETTVVDRERIFNLGYFTWVEQQGVPTGAFETRRRQEFWTALRPKLTVWDELIGEFNSRTKVEVE